MGCLDLCVCVRSDAITDRGRAEKNAQCIGCQLLEGKAREASICCQLLSTTKGGSSTEGCGTVYRSRIARNLCLRCVRRVLHLVVIVNPSNDISLPLKRADLFHDSCARAAVFARVQSWDVALEMGRAE